MAITVLRVQSVLIVLYLTNCRSHFVLFLCLLCSASVYNLGLHFNWV